MPMIDAEAYHDLAAALAQGRMPGSDLFWQPALFPLLLGAFYSVAGASVLAAQVGQAVLGALTCVLTRRLGVRLFGARVGLAAGLATACCGPLIFHEAELVGAGLAALWAVVLLLLLTDERRRTGPAWPLLWGLCGGLSILTRTEFLPFFLVASLASLLPGRGPAGAAKRLAVRVAAVALGFAVVILPASLLNERLSGHFTFLPASGGLNLYIGNNPDTCRTLAIRPGWAWDRLVREPHGKGARDSWEGQAYFVGETLRFAREKPGLFLSGLADKTVQLLSSREIPRNLDVYTFRQWSPLLRLLVWRAGSFGFPFGILLPLAVAGIILERRRLGWPTVLFLVLYPAAIILVFVSARYRAPILPVLAILAAAGFGGMVTALRRRQWPALRRAAVAASAATILSTVPGPFCTERLGLEGELYRFVGQREYRQGRRVESIANFRKAISFDPLDAEAHNYLGIALFEQGNSVEAQAHLRRTIEINPAFEQAHHNLGVVLAAEGRVDEAVESYRRAIDVNPSFASPYFNLGELLAGLRRTDEAITYLRFGLAIEPSNEPARHQLEALERGRR